MLKKENNEALYWKILKALFGDQILIYTVLIMMSVMYHYRSSLVYVYGLAAWIIGALVFRLFDYIAAHKLIGSAAYIALFSAFMLAGRFCVNEGAAEYPISFGVWFLTPQDSLDYSRWYTLAMFIYFMIFMASVVYYFTKVRYRIFMNFLIFIIPFALYGKEYEKMPTAFIILLAIGYIVTMINCRQLTAKNETVIVGKDKLWKSTAVYVVIFASLAAVIPKPVIEADRELLDELIAADAFTDRLLATVSIFRDTSTGDEFRELSDETVLYFVRADEPLRLKTTTYTTYDYAKDSWSVSEYDTRFVYTNTEQDISAYQVDDILEAIALAAETDSDFAEKFGLESVKSAGINPAESSRVTIVTAGQRAQFAPVPPLMTELIETSYDDEIAVTRAGLLYCVENYFRSNETFAYEYSSEGFFYNPENKALLDIMSRDDYSDLLSDAALVLYGDYGEQSETLSDASYEFEYRASNYLDYGENSEIYDLAAEITAGLTTDYDKAKAIEAYFADNNYLYDLNYRKEKDDNVVDFIFDAKRGVCYEYATAMVLLARAAGIPARYAEGYNLYEPYTNNRLGTNFVIKSKSAHGFPELYIRGAGWVSFEPTVSTLAPVEREARAVDKLSYAGIFLLALALIFLLCMKFYPVAVHKVFLIRVKRMNPSDSAANIMRRICRLYKLNVTLTSHEAAECILAETGCSVEFAADLFDRAVYGECSVTEAEKELALTEYCNLYDIMKKIKKTKYRKLGQTT